MDAGRRREGKVNYFEYRDKGRPQFELVDMPEPVTVEEARLTEAEVAAFRQALAARWRDDDDRPRNT